MAVAEAYCFPLSSFRFPLMERVRKPSTIEKTLKSEGRSIMSEAKKCAHPNFSCKAPEGKAYCGVQCETAAKTPDIDCKCGHPGCKGRAT
jgi:hypothetical protein